MAKYTIGNLRLISNFCPTQWEGLTTDGQYVYFRYRHGYLSADIAESKEAWWENPLSDAPDKQVLNKRVGEELDGEMTYEELVKHTAPDFDFPPFLTVE